MSGAPPLVPGRIHGVRLWSASLGCGSMALCGLNGEAWMIGGEATTAKCRRGGPYPNYRPPHAGDHTPASDCSCGLYSMHPWPAQVSEVTESLLYQGSAGMDFPVMGIVEAWGRIEVHEDGIRAQYARPRALIHFPDQLPDDYGEILAVLAKTYGVGIVAVRDAGSIVTYCAANAPGMDEAAVERLLFEPREPDDPSEEAEPVGPSAEAGGWHTEAAWFWEKIVGKGKPLAERIGTIALNLVMGILMIAWYGFWVLAGVGIVGAILFGWWDQPPPPPPPPPRAAPALRVVDERIVRDGPTATYVAVVRNTSHRNAAVGVHPFGEFRDRHGHRRGGPDRRRRVELAPTIPPGATGVVYDDLDRRMARATRLDVEFAAKMVRSRPAPFSVGPAHVNRRLCIITASLRADRALDRSRISAVGREDGHLSAVGTFTVGPIPKGVSSQVLTRVDPDSCARRPPAITAFPAPDPRQVVVRGQRGR